MSETAENVLPLWVVYDHPTDFPDRFVARRHDVTSTGNRPTDLVIEMPNLDGLREKLGSMGLVPVARHPNDDPKIVETWL